MKLNRNTIFYLLILIIVVLCVWLIFHIKTEEYKCMSRPMQYVASHIVSSNGKPITCTCGAFDSRASIEFNASTIIYNPQYKDFTTSKLILNFSNK